MAPAEEGHLRVGTLAYVRRRNRTVTTESGHVIAVFYHNGQVYAVDNQCPHAGYPLVQGQVKEGVLTCAMHQARFDVASGGSIDSYGEDLCAYPVSVVDDEVWVNPTPGREINA